MISLFEEECESDEGGSYDDSASRLELARDKDPSSAAPSGANRACGSRYFGPRPESTHSALLVGTQQKVYRDDLTGQILDPELVHAARRKELEYFNAKGVWVKCELSLIHI